MKVAEFHISGVDAANGNHGQIAVIPAIGTDQALDAVRQGRYHRMNHWCFLPCANPDARPVRLAALLAMIDDIANSGKTPGNDKVATVGHHRAGLCRILGHRGVCDDSAHGTTGKANASAD